jgi:G3E family GTPase
MDSPNAWFRVADWVLACPQTLAQRQNLAAASNRSPLVGTRRLLRATPGQTTRARIVFMIPITVLTGFLGSGKTTLLRRWRQDQTLANAAWIIQDLSEFGLDAELPSDEETSPSAGILTGRVLGEITDLSPRHSLVLVESTGAARPWPLIAVFTEQLAFANIIIATKTDTIPQQTAQQQVKPLQRLQPRAAIGLSANAGLTLSQLVAIPAPNLESFHRRAENFGLLDHPSQGVTAVGIDFIILREKRPFHPQRLLDVCQNQLGTGLYRTVQEHLTE